MRRAKEIRGSLLMQNTILNFFGQLMPVLVGAVAIPYTVHGLGIERFGVLSLAWVVLGYFSLFDIGLGRASTKFVAEALGRDQVEQIPTIVWSALATQLLLGGVGSVAMIRATPLLVGQILRVPRDLIPEAEAAFFVLSVSIPIVLCTANLRGVLQAAQRFDLGNAVQVPASSLSFLLPAVGVALGLGLPAIVLLLLIARIATAVVYLILCFLVFPVLKVLALNTALIRTLIIYGGWVTVANLIIPVMVYLDRFVIASLLSVSDLGYYSPPYEAVSRLLIVPSSLLVVLFPAFSMISTYQSKHDLGTLLFRSMKLLIVVMGLATLGVVMFARDFLYLWLGSEFAMKSTAVLQILAIGILFNALAQVPAEMLDAVGRPDLRAKIFIGLVPLNIFMVLWLISDFGIIGAATAWTARAAMELLVFSIVSWRLLRLKAHILIESGFMQGTLAFTGLMGIEGIMLAIPSSGEAIWVRGFMASVSIIFFACFIWFHALDRTEKSGLKTMVSGLATVGRSGIES